MASTRGKKTAGNNRSRPQRRGVDAVSDSRSFADALQRTLYERGLSQQEAAAQMGVTRQLVNDWLHRRRKPGPQHTARVATWLGVSTDDLMRLTGKAVEATVDDRLRDLERQVRDLHDIVVRLLADDAR